MSTYLYSRSISAQKHPNQPPSILHRHQATTPTDSAALAQQLLRARADKDGALSSASPEDGPERTTEEATPTDHATPATPDQTQTTTNTYVTVLLGLLPSEVIVLHSAFMAYATEPDVPDIAGESTIVISNPGALTFAFVFLLFASVFLYVIGQIQTKDWDNRWDYARMLIPPLAFFGWCLLEPVTAFDAVGGSLPEAWRKVLGLSIAVTLSGLATLLAFSIPGAAPEGPERGDGDDDAPSSPE
ncbi:MAG: hypothetical protein AAF624_11315 [Bacteroidota bacterium]